MFRKLEYCKKKKKTEKCITSWIIKLNIANMSFLSGLIDKPNIIPIKNPWAFLQKVIRLILTHKELQMTQKIQCNPVKENSWRIQPDFKTYDKVKVIKTMTQRQISGMESKIFLHLYLLLTFYIKGQIIQRGKESASANDADVYMKNNNAHQPPKMYLK